MVGDGAGVEETHLLAGGAVASSEELASHGRPNTSRMWMRKSKKKKIAYIAAVA